MKDKSIIKNVKIFLLDLDGTIYLDDDVFDGVYTFLDKIKEKNKKYIFLTNNSSKDKYAYFDKLKSLNINSSLDSIFSSGMAMGMYLEENYQGKSVYLVGTKALERELSAYNVKIVKDNPDIVLVGFDRELTYEKLEKACEYLDNGAIFLATNSDFVCPVKNKKYIPDCASICEMITHATGKKPLFIGKPNPYMIDKVREKEKVNRDEVMMIGDRIYTDVLAGVNARVLSCLVLSGESTIDTLNESDVKPDFVFDSVKDLTNLI